MQEKIREIIENHMSQILTQLEDYVDTDTVKIEISVECDEFKCRLGC